MIVMTCYKALNLFLIYSDKYFFFHFESSSPSHHIGLQSKKLDVKPCSTCDEFQKSQEMTSDYDVE